MPFFSFVLVLLQLFVLVVVLTLVTSTHAQKVSQPFKGVNLDTFELPPMMPGGILIRGQASPLDYSIPDGNWVELSASDTANTKRPFFNTANLSTSFHATGYESASTWKTMLQNIYYHSSLPTSDAVTWWTLEMYTYTPNIEPAVGYVASPSLDFPGAVGRCVSYSSVHTNPDDDFDGVIISGLTQSFVSKKNLSEQWIGVAYDASENDYKSVSGPFIGQRVAYQDGSGCDSTIDCDWAPGQPSSSSLSSNSAVTSTTANNNKWSVVSDGTDSNNNRQSWCVDYTVHLWLICKVDSTKPASEGAACQYNSGGVVVTTMPPQTPGSPTNVVGNTTSTSSVSPVTTATTVMPETTATTVEEQQTSSISVPTTTTSSFASTTATATTSTPAMTSSTTTTTSATPPPTTTTTTTSGNGTSPQSAAENDDEDTTSAAARAGVIFGVGIVAVAIVVGGIVFTRKWLMSRQHNNNSSGGKNSNNKKLGVNQFSDADQELMATLFSTTA